MRNNKLRGVALTMTAVLLLAGCTNPNTLPATFPALTQSTHEETAEVLSEETTASSETEATSSDEGAFEETVLETAQDEETREENVSEEVTVAEESEVETAAPETTPAPTEAETTQAPVTVISVTGKANGTHYIGDTLSAVDFEIIVSMSDGTTLTNPAGFEVSPLTLSAASNTLTCSYGGVSSTFTVAAAERPAEAPTQVPTTPEPATEEIRETAGTVDFDALRSAAVGDFITLGRYEQDYIFENGKEAIEWLVLEKQGDKMLVISRYGLEEYSVGDGGEEWKGCRVRSFLNTQFYEEAFVSEEKALILDTIVKTDVNPNHGTGSYETLDRIFLLSDDEANRFFADNDSRKCYTTPYSRSGSYVSRLEDSCQWWLRSPGSSAYGMGLVFQDGGIDYSSPGYYNFCNDYGKNFVRPAMWIKLEP